MRFSLEEIQRTKGDLSEIFARMSGAEAQEFEGLSVPEGEWEAPEHSPALGYLVIAGFVARRVELAGGASIELFGPGELLRIGGAGTGDEFDMVPADVRWTVLAPLALAVLDDAFAEQAGADPALQRALMVRNTRRSDALALRLALVGLPRVSSRLHFLLWQLADRYGTPGRSGVLMPLHLSNGLLAELVSCGSDEVRSAMRELAEQGVIAQAPRGLWLNGAPPRDMVTGLSPQLGRD